MKNTLSDLNNHLFAQLERLGEEDLDEDEIKKEVQRSKAITDVAKVIPIMIAITICAMCARPDKNV